MRTLKSILPAIAFIGAIGMSFAFINATEAGFYTTGFVEIDRQWYQIDIDCVAHGVLDCRVQIEGETQTYLVYSQPDVYASLLKNGIDLPKVIPDPR